MSKLNVSSVAELVRLASEMPARGVVRRADPLLALRRPLADAKAPGPSIAKARAFTMPVEA
jgi:hypothetical protein